MQRVKAFSMANQLYEFTLKVARGEGCDLAQPLTGAYVPAYSAAPDYQTAIRKAVTAIADMHYIFEDIEGAAREIPIGTWQRYVHAVWPDFASRLPSEEELPSLVERGAVFFGPFAGYS
jgi:hypothetical protein